MELTTSWKEEGRAEGLAKGRAEGRAEGLTEGSRQTVLPQLRRRWGSLAPALEARVRKLPVEEVQELAEALFDLGTAGDLKRWLTAH